MINDDAQRLVAGSHPDPFAVLGQHLVDGKIKVRAYHPDADGIDVIDAKSGRKVMSLSMFEDAHGFFEGTAPRRKTPFAYRLKFTKGPHVWEVEDSYRFGPVLGELDEHLIAEGAWRSCVGTSRRYRNPFRGLGPQCETCVCRRGLQRLGRTPQSNAWTR